MIEECHYELANPNFGKIKILPISEIFGIHKGERCLIVGSGPSLDDLEADFWHDYDFVICSNLVLYTPADYVVRPDDFGFNVLSLKHGCFFEYKRKLLKEEDVFDFESHDRLIGHGDTVCKCVSLAWRLGASHVGFAGCDFTFEGYAKRRYKQRPSTPIKMSAKAWNQIETAKDGIDKVLKASGMTWEFLT